MAFILRRATVVALSLYRRRLGHARSLAEGHRYSTRPSAIGQPRLDCHQRSACFREVRGDALPHRTRLADRVDEPPMARLEPLSNDDAVARPVLVPL